jgi:hypothetical protein
MVSGFPFVVAKRAGAEPGCSVTLEITGPLSFRTCVVVDEEGRGRPAESVPDPAVTLTMGWEGYVRLSAGRCGPADVRTSVDGDRDLAERILGTMSVTP